MTRLVRVCVILAIAVAATGCTTGQRADDPAASAVRDAHSSVASLALAVELLLDDRSTLPATEVVLQQCLEDVGSAQQQVITAADADPQRRGVANTAIGDAVDVLVALGTRGAGELDRSDLEHFEQLERELAAAAEELQA